MNKLNVTNPFALSTKQLTFLGVLFLIAYWWFGFDGITFSDDVYYLNAGKSFWDGTMEVNEYHFSSRWGAYVPSGLIGHLLGFDPHIISLISLVSYVVSLVLLVKILPKKNNAWVLIIWFSTQVYLMHFITKVYPDGLLVLFTTLVPIAATYRFKRPIAAGTAMVLALFFGFLTKETIVILAPFPIILFILDYKRQQVRPAFYWSLTLTGILLLGLYLGYFLINFGDPLYRISSINAGHYISEFTYADKGFWSIAERLTILPILTFVERSYWAWIVFAIPGIALGLRQKTPTALEFSISFLCLVIGFWFMTSTLEFYNPIYLNPRHLIIIVPTLAYLIALGWPVWTNSWRWRKVILVLMVFGLLISMYQADWKMAAFQFGILILVYVNQFKFRDHLLSILLISAALAAIVFQQKTKQYPMLINTLKEELQKTTNQSILVSNNFIDFSKKVLYPDEKELQEKLNGLDYIFLEENLSTDTIHLFLYNYYQHAYPQEQTEIDSLINKLEFLNYSQVSDANSELFWKRVFVRQAKN